MLDDYRGALEDLDKADVLEPNNAFTLKYRGDVKRTLKEYKRALEDLNKADVLEPNNAFTLIVCGDVKYMLDDYQGALEIMDKKDPNQRPGIQEVLQHFEGLNKKKGIQYIPTSIPVYFNILSKRFVSAFKLK
ncbi:unnamed protein product [Sphagnum jensenii]|uniref:Uncharacterized protein n=1 Tax=Sphagnum jensenii TaxID=128206 RepID=A0ABP1AD40_9BRYO